MLGFSLNAHTTNAYLLEKLRKKVAGGYSVGTQAMRASTRPRDPPS